MLRLVAVVALVGVVGLGPPSGTPFETLKVGCEDIDMANLDRLRLSISVVCSSDVEGDMDAL